MGGATGTGAGIGAALGVALAPFTGGTSLALGAGTLGLLGAGAGAAGGKVFGKTFNDIGGADNAASNMKTANAEQAAKAAGLQQQLLEQPKQISPDNFLAQKNRLLANMRLGLASTITGSGGSPSPVLSAPALTGAVGKTKLGA